MSMTSKKVLEYLKELSTFELFLDNITIEEKNARQIIKSAIYQLEKQQKEIEKYEQQIDLEFVEKNFIEKNKVVSKDKIREIFQFYIERDSLFNDNTHKMAVIRLKDVLEELLEEN